ncbi:hypothetical protein N0V90_006826 [Kalmusia sp. IMI 367209]|nr:hypothetical protein N0V90_006826 [Kalmusia sp. IMI 367209]
MDPDLRIIVDGDTTQVYRRGDKVSGRVILGTADEEDITALKISFLGVCTTTTTRSMYTPHDADVTQPAQRFQERVQLFRFEHDLLSSSLPALNKDSWIFDFKFPELTEPKYSRWQHGPRYPKTPHPLPPSFQTNTPGGQAIVSYFLQATLERGGSKDALEIHEYLPYHPTPEDMHIEPKVLSRVLYAQIWKPLSDSRTAIDKAFARMSRRNSANGGNNPRIVPTIYYPEMISPGQNMPLYLSLEDTQAAAHACQRLSSQCVLDSVTVTISTHTTTICGKAATQPEDVMVKHVNCLSKNNMAKPMPFGTKVKLANNFRLVDDAECVPSFKTYTITRRYDLTVAIGLKYEGRHFTVRCTTLLEILPRIPRELLPSMPEDEEVEIDPLPLYIPREPSREFAPVYESLYSLSNSPSSSASLDRTESGGSSIISGVATPASEHVGMHFGGIMIRSR